MKFRESDLLIEYIKSGNLVDELWDRIHDIESTVDSLDDNIEEADRVGLDEVVNKLCEVRNNLNLSRIELELQVHNLEIKQLEFEKIRQLTR